MDDPQRTSSDTQPGSDAGENQPARAPAEYPFATGAGVPEPSGGVPPPPTDALPGDAAPTPIIAVSEPVATPAMPATSTPNAVIIRPPATTATGPRGVTFTLWMLIWVAAWGGAMSLTLGHRFDRKFDWNTSYFSVAARNLLREGFTSLRGGLYLTAGEGFGTTGEFYAGHPPLTAWILAGWMHLFGQSDAAIRALPLVFTALNLMLLYALVRRVFGAPAALAATVFCSLLPMTAVYSQYVNMEPFELTFLLGASLGYLWWARSGSRVGYLLLCLCIVLGCWTDWPMYLFAGLLAVAHLLQPRDLLAPVRRGAAQASGTEEKTPGRPVLASLTLLVLPLAVFTVFLVYLRLNGASISDLLARARERGGATTQPSGKSGYGELLGHLTSPTLLRQWLVGLFTPPALVLATLGALFWVTWSRRLSLVSGERARRAAFRIVFCLILMQLIYTVAFPAGATVHEFWQYYLIVPVAVLAAGLCTWLTVAGGVGRSFLAGLLDRAGWAVAAMIPLAAAGPFVYRMQIALPGHPPRGGEGLHFEYVDDLRRHTDARDLILTDLDQDGLKRALPWYADRAILPYEGTDAESHDTRSLEGIAKIVAKFPGRRVLYLWEDAGPEKLFEQLNTSRYPSYELGLVVVYLIEGVPAPAWKKAGIQSPKAATQASPAPVVAPVPPPATAPSTRPAAATTAATTKPAP